MNGMQLRLFKNETTPIAHAAPKAELRYAVVQVSANVVWGIGINKGKAISDAFKWILPFEDMAIEKIGDMYEAIESGELRLVRCSRKLWAYVKKYGGQQHAGKAFFAVVDGEAVLEGTEGENT